MLELREVACDGPSVYDYIPGMVSHSDRLEQAKVVALMCVKGLVKATGVAV